MSSTTPSCHRYTLTFGDDGMCGRAQCAELCDGGICTGVHSRIGTQARSLYESILGHGSVGCTVDLIEHSAVESSVDCALCPTGSCSGPPTLEYSSRRRSSVCRSTSSKVESGMVSAATFHVGTKQPARASGCRREPCGRIEVSRRRPVRTGGWTADADWVRRVTRSGRESVIGSGTAIGFGRIRDGAWRSSPAGYEAVADVVDDEDAQALPDHPVVLAPLGKSVPTIRTSLDGVQQLSTGVPACPGPARKRHTTEHGCYLRSAATTGDDELLWISPYLWPPVA
jgi:hypothetical protein